MHPRKSAKALFWVVAATLLAAGAGCRSIAMGESTKITWTGDPRRLETEILRVVPIGTPTDVAFKIMEANGCKCSYVTQEKYLWDAFVGAKKDAETTGDSLPWVKRGSDEKTPYLLCDIHNWPFWPVYQAWSIRLYSTQNTVTDVKVFSNVEIGPLP